MVDVLPVTETKSWNCIYPAYINSNRTLKVNHLCRLYHTSSGNRAQSTRHFIIHFIIYTVLVGGTGKDLGYRGARQIGVTITCIMYSTLKRNFGGKVDRARVKLYGFYRSQNLPKHSRSPPPREEGGLRKRRG